MQKIFGINYDDYNEEENKDIFIEKVDKEINKMNDNFINIENIDIINENEEG